MAASSGMTPEALASASDEYLADAIKNLNRGAKFGVGRHARDGMAQLRDQLIEEQRRRARPSPQTSPAVDESVQVGEGSQEPETHLRASTVTRLRFHADQVDSESLAARFGAEGSPMMSEDLDLAATAAIDDLARRLGGGDPRFRREIGSVAITGYMAGRILLGTTESRLAYSAPKDAGQNARRIKKHAQQTGGYVAKHLTSDFGPFLLGAASYASKLGVAAEKEDSFVLLGMAATQGFATAIAEHDLFAPHSVAGESSYAPRTANTDTITPTDTDTVIDSDGRLIRVTVYYNGSSETTINDLEATETGHMLMFTLQQDSHELARLTCERHILEKTEFGSEDLVAIETIKQAPYIECTANVQLEQGDPRGKSDYAAIDR